MIDNLIRFSVRNKLIVGIFVLALILRGIYALNNLAIDAVPDITNNQVQVITISPALAPQEIEKFITYPVELGLANIQGVEEIRSISRYGLSVVTVVFEEQMPIMKARQLVGENLQMLQKDIPPEIGSPEMMPITTGLGEIYQYTLEVKPGYEDRYDATELRSIQDWIVKRQLSGIEGIVEVSSFGGYLKQYEVAIDPEKIRAYEVTLDEIYEALQRNNANTGGSYIEREHRAFYIRTEGLLQLPEEIGNIVIKADNNLPVLVKDVATVGFGYAPRFGAMTKDGKGEAVGGITLMLKGANAYQVVKNVKERVELVQKSLPEGLEIKPYLDRGELVSRVIKTVSTNLIEGGLIVIFILILLLGNLRAGLIVASVIPLSMLFALTMMEIFGISANLMSLGAIDFGLVVDGALIIVESIVHRLQHHFPNQKLSQAQMDESVTASAIKIRQSAAFGEIIILIVYLPLLVLVGIEGKMFRPMAQTVSFAILGALILSLTYVPMLSSLVLSRRVSVKRTFADRLMSFLHRLYVPTLRLALRYSRFVIVLSLLLFAFSLWLFTQLGAVFVPNLEEGDLAMQMTIPPGSSLSESIKTSTKAEKVLLANFPEVRSVVSKIGTAEVPTDPMAVEDGDIMILLKPKSEWTSARTREELVEKMKAKLEVILGASFEFTQPIQLRFNELMTGVKADLAIKIYGEDLETLFEEANKAKRLVQDLPGVGDIRVEQIEGLPQIMIKYDRLKIAKFGLDIAQLNQLVRTATAGEQAGIIFEGEKRFDLVVRVGKAFRNQPNLFENIYVRTPNNQQIPLSELAAIEYIKGPMQISRENTNRLINIGINVRNRDVQSLVKEIQTVFAQKLELPPGYFIRYGGAFENLQAAQERLQIAVPLALVLIVLLLFFTFGSMRQALMIFTAVPLSAIGGIFALWLRDLPFSISAAVGFIALFGVAVLNGIVLIGYFNQLKQEGVNNLEERIYMGTGVRLRPVIMTAAVASLGFLPMAVSNTAGGEVQRPLASVVIGGLIVATFLTLIVLPVIYKVVEKQDK